MRLAALALLCSCASAAPSPPWPPLPVPLESSAMTELGCDDSAERCAYCYARDDGKRAACEKSVQERCR
jgi:hypothetical protein